MHNQTEARPEPAPVQPPYVTGEELDAYFDHLPPGKREAPKLPELPRLWLPQPDYPIDVQQPVIGQVTNKILRQYLPRLLGSGGENYVYEVKRRKKNSEPYKDTEKDKRLIIKIEKNVLKEIIRSNIAHDAPLDELPKEVRTVVQEYLHKEYERLQEVKKYFGAEHVLKQKKYLRKIPVNKALLNEFFDAEPPINFDTTKEVWAVVTVQERAAELNQEDTFSATVGFDMDEAVIYEKEYRLLNERLIHSLDTKAEFDSQLFFDIQPDRGLQPLLAEASTDTDLREMLKDFVTKTIVYARETGEIIDIFGPNNIVFFQNGTRWTYRLLDPMYATTYFESSHLIASAQEILHKIAAQQQLTGNEYSIILTVLNFVRTINGLAVFLGIKERLDIIPSELKNAQLDFAFLVANKFPRTEQRAAA